MLAEGEITLRVGTGEVVSARSFGNLRLFFEDRFIILDNVLFVPGLKRNLISISCLLEQLYKVSFEINEVFISKRGCNDRSSKIPNHESPRGLKSKKKPFNTSCC